MEEVSKKYKFGITVNLNDKNSPNKLYDDYANLDIKKLEKYSNEFIKKSILENKMFKKMIINL